MSRLETPRFAHHFHDRVGEPAERYRRLDTQAGRDFARPDDDQWNVKERFIQAIAMKEQGVLCKMLSVIGRDDDERVRQFASALQCIEHPPHVEIESPDTILIRSAEHLDLIAGDFILLNHPPVPQEK